MLVDAFVVLLLVVLLLVFFMFLTTVVGAGVAQAFWLELHDLRAHPFTWASIVHHALTMGILHTAATIIQWGMLFWMLFTAAFTSGSGYHLLAHVRNSQTAFLLSLLLGLGLEDGLAEG